MKVFAGLVILAFVAVLMYEVEGTFIGVDKKPQETQVVYVPVQQNYYPQQQQQYQPNKYCGTYYVPDKYMTVCGAYQNQCISFLRKEHITTYNCQYNTLFKQVDPMYCQGLAPTQLGYCRSH